MANETTQLAAYAAALRYEDLPEPVIQRAKDCIADTIATIAFGAHLPWSQIIADHAARTGRGGKSTILGPGGARVQAPSARENGDHRAPERMQGGCGGNVTCPAGVIPTRPGSRQRVPAALA